MPSSAETHIQNSTPGPPAAIASATPAIFPVPTVPPSAVESAWSGETPPPSAGRAKRRSVPNMHCPGRLSCTAREQCVSQRPAAANMHSAGAPQTSRAASERAAIAVTSAGFYAARARKMLDKRGQMCFNIAQRRECLTLWTTAHAVTEPNTP